MLSFAAGVLAASATSAAAHPWCCRTGARRPAVANLAGTPTNLDGADLRGAVLAGAFLLDAALVGAKLFDADLAGSHIVSNHSRVKQPRDTFFTGGPNPWC